jgi:hypothetical protein
MYLWLYLFKNIEQILEIEKSNLYKVTEVQILDFWKRNAVPGAGCACLYLALLDSHHLLLIPLLPPPELSPAQLTIKVVRKKKSCFQKKYLYLGLCVSDH